eukprot:scaffold81144_cov36-Phaeocystis_antarctica.AAC.1
MAVLTMAVLTMAGPLGPRGAAAHGGPEAAAAAGWPAAAMLTMAILTMAVAAARGRPQVGGPPQLAQGQPPPSP